jgi:pilus assembly protein CpaC
LKLLCLLLLLTYPAAAAERLILYSGESRVIEVNNPRKTVIGNRAILTARKLSDEEMLINAKQPGLTSLVLWGAAKEMTSYEIEVQASGLKKDMIEIDVQVLELSDAAGWDVGIDWPALMNGEALAPATAASPIQALEQAAPPLLSFGTFSRGPINIALEALVQKNKAKLLAKPKLLTVSGGSARFLAGGQIPVVHQDSQGRINTEYKDYGVALNIQPKSDEDGNINATSRAEVSNIDAANSVTTGNGVFPALKSRWVETTIYVKKNGTIVIAGMIGEEQTRITRGIPLLSEIPILGELFRINRIVNRSSELVIFVTPRVV